MALTATTLNGAITANSRQVRLTSATGINVGDYLQVNGELMGVSDNSLASSGVVGVRRGLGGTLAQAANTLAICIYGPPADMPNKHQLPVVVNYGADGAITPPDRPTLIVITKGSAAALTLTGPTADAINFPVTILSATAFAHTVTYTPGFYGDTTSSDVATFAAKVGASMTIIPQKGLWGVQALANVTLA